ncbi:probable WRKY transcription factor 17 isoform X2 [Rutidosis leptorrhynchoides]|uniref:probable WRKY transcription factor 17 isoform X2 n=1 Tax=Rutidosis leptorrhynchoides TaxID=125765 RepID=UPI003A997F28
MAVDLVGIQALEHLNRIFQNHDFTVSSNINKAVSALKRSGHARFRRGPSPSSPDSHAPSTSSQSEEQFPKKPPVIDTTSSFRSMTSSPVLSSAEGSVSNGKQLSSLGIVAPAPSFSSRKPPLPSSYRKRVSTDSPSVSVHGSKGENHSVSRSSCHCCKRRKTETKRRIEKIPITGSKVDCIPADNYSWKKYGQKKVDGSPFPRVYYKCNSSKGCPARKRVELAVTESRMLIVTYDREHRHHHNHTPTPLPTSFTGLQIQ